jgi:predicted nucleic acid-binding protein
MAQLPPLAHTCEAVIVEASHLLRRDTPGKRGLLELLTNGKLTIPFSLSAEIREVRSLIERYENVPMSLADACLVRMSELVPDCVVFTLDSDFRIYRRHKRQKIPLLMPPDV